MINNNFKAVFNPFTKQLAVLYGDQISEYTFNELDEWFGVCFNGQDTHPNFLDIHLHYDESLQLLFYPREEGNNSLNESHGVCFNSNEMDNIPDKIKLVYNDTEWNIAYKELQK